MKKKIELYFTSEDDAESAHASLNTLKNHHLAIEEMRDETDARMFIPYNSGHISITNILGEAPLGTSGGIFPTRINNDEERDKITHLMRVEIAEENYDKFLKIIGKLDCYMRK